MKVDSSAPTGPALLPLLRKQAESRRLVATESELSPADIFALVRDMPYLRASSRQPDAILREWRGTCSGKHYLLKELFEELGYRAQIVMCTHQFTEENTRHFPAVLRVHLADGPVPDVHTFLRLRGSDGWTQIDATWPLAAAALGMPVNRSFEPGVDMQLACDPIEHFEVPAGVTPQVFKEQLIQTFCGPAMIKRELLIEGIGEWLGKHTSQPRGS